MCNFQLDKEDKRIEGHSLNPKLRQKPQKGAQKNQGIQKTKDKDNNSHKSNWTKLTS